MFLYKSICFFEEFWTWSSLKLGHWFMKYLLFRGRRIGAFCMDNNGWFGLLCGWWDVWCRWLVIDVYCRWFDVWVVVRHVRVWRVCGLWRWGWLSGCWFRSSCIYRLLRSNNFHILFHYHNRFYNNRLQHRSSILICIRLNYLFNWKRFILWNIWLIWRICCLSCKLWISFENLLGFCW